MSGLGKTGTARVSPAGSQEIYQRYAVALYRQALLKPRDPASAGHVAGDVLVNECALAAIPERGEDDAPLSRVGREQEKNMRALGYATALTVAAAGTGLGVLAVKSLPDVRRYLAMRKMLFEPTDRDGPDRCHAER